MNLREILKPYLLEWPMTDQVGTLTFELNRLVSQLDDLALGYEAKWGMGQLEAWAAADNPDLAAKFQRQGEKLGEALAAKDLVATRNLVDGFARAYKALEADAMSRGRVGTEPVVFFYRCGSMAYKMVRTISESRAMAQEQGCVVMSCEELINLYDKKAFDVYAARQQTKVVIDAQNFNWTTGDELPPEF